MHCSRPGTTLALWMALSSIALAYPGALIWCSLEQPAAARHREAPQLEATLGRAPLHISELSSVSIALPRCREENPPEALLTPDPLLPIQNDDRKVRVSFIIGADGHVHSAFILDSGGPEEDQSILRVVRFWRYRPALCNGVPTDSEAQVRFNLQ